MTKAIKLTKAQQTVMDQAHKEIDLARSLDYTEWLKATEFRRDFEFAERHPEFKDSIEKNFEEAVRKEKYKHYWEAERRGEVLTHCNSKTLLKLEEMGLIEIIRISTGTAYGIDEVKILNY